MQTKHVVRPMIVINGWFLLVVVLVIVPSCICLQVQQLQHIQPTTTHKPTEPRKLRTMKLLELFLSGRGLSVCHRLERCRMVYDGLVVGWLWFVGSEMSQDGFCWSYCVWVKNSLSLISHRPAASACVRILPQLDWIVFS